MKIRGSSVGIVNIDSKGFDLVVLDKFVLFLAAKFLYMERPSTDFNVIVNSSLIKFSINAAGNILMTCCNSRSNNYLCWSRPINAASCVKTFEAMCRRTWYLVDTRLADVYPSKYNIIKNALHIK